MHRRLSQPNIKKRTPKVSVLNSSPSVGLRRVLVAYGSGDFLDFGSDTAIGSSLNIRFYSFDSRFQISSASGCHSFWRNDLSKHLFCWSAGVILIGAMQPVPLSAV